MDKAEFQALEIADQVKYISSVESLSKAYKQLGISKGIGGNFKKQAIYYRMVGYIELISKS
jgi:hypothetical protein